MAIRFVLFDAVGTLIYPQPDAAEVYASVGRRYGSQLTREQIKPRFRAALANVFGDEAARRNTNEATERENWRRLVGAVFSELPQPTAPFEALWEYFSMPRNWQLFDDVAPALAKLRNRGLELGVASNFDQRLHRIVAGHEPLTACRHVFVSSQVGYAKPDPAYYEVIQSRLGATPDEILLVGDDRENDVEAPRRAGWQALQVCREAAFSGDIHNLTEVKQWLSQRPASDPGEPNISKKGIS